MNKIRKFFWLFAIVISASLLSSCVKEDFDTPEIEVPTVNFAANTTIADLKATYPGGGVLDSITDDLIIKGRVVSSDEEGNFYQVLAIQDDNAGIQVKIETKSTYLHYAIGQEVYIKCKGLIMSSYGDLVQLGVRNGAKLGYITNVQVKDHLFRNGLPTAVIPDTLTSATGIGIAQYENMLVVLKNVSFARAGQVAVPGSDDYDNTIKFADGTELIMRTSSYAKYAKKLLPSGSGNIVGVMTRYRTTLQLVVSTWADIQNFEGGTPTPTGDYPTPDPTATALDSLTVGFDGATVDQPIVVTGWVNVALTGSRTWQGKDFGGNQYAQATAYKATEAMVSWLLSAPVKYNSAHKLSFKSAMAYWTHTTMTPMKVYLMYNYDASDPSKAVWTELAPTLPTSAGTNYTFVESGSIALKDYVPAGYTGNVYVAFRYEGDPSQTTTFQVDDVKIGKGGNGGGGSTTLLDEQFTTTLGSFKAFSVVGTQAWVWANFGSGCAKMSGYATTNNENEDWLVSPAINLSNKVGAILNVNQAANYVNGHPEYLKILASSDYDGTSDPSTQGTWVELTVPTWPAGNNWTFVDSGDISLSAFDGKSKVYVAFKYNSTSSVGSTWEIGSVTVK